MRPDPQLRLRLSRFGPAQQRSDRRRRTPGVVPEDILNLVQGWFRFPSLSWQLQRGALSVGGHEFADGLLVAFALIGRLPVLTVV